ncbi:Momilactone A synthase [Acorus gramineus]|uniref:Momilactone A synthase n=1 Tax=Acorus gramineus TaxID=55184 RepID=A0AAV9AHH6_ACOGR|nr:Momilactone A synthase [Acorus gramineus]
MFLYHILILNYAGRLEGKVAIITGGASGLGECTARLFSNHGAKVVIADVQDDLGHSVCESIGRNSAHYVHCNVTNEPDVRNAVDEAVAKHGRLDIMFNNAGIIDKPKPSIEDVERGDFAHVLDTNVVGPFLGVKHAARAMIRARRGGCIVSTASTASLLGGAATCAYTCAKHAVVGLTKDAAAELGQYGIRVNCVSPGGVATPLARAFTGMRAEEMEELMSAHANLKGVGPLKAEDIAEAVLYLASDEARYVSGLNLVVDGGFTVVDSSRTSRMVWNIRQE